jgi:hypothetical protein
MVALPFHFHTRHRSLAPLTLSLALILTGSLAACSTTSAKPPPASVPVNLTVSLSTDSAARSAQGNVEASVPGNVANPAPPAGEASAPVQVAGPAPGAVEGIPANPVEAPVSGRVEGPPLLVATLRNIVVQQKAGPLGRRSYWHEYVVSLADRGGVPLVIEAATLINARGEPVAPGDNPWVLANTSKSWIDRSDARGVTSPGRIAAGSLAAGALWPVAGSPALLCLSWEAYGVGAAIIVPVYAVNAIAFNVQGRKRVEADFQRHRLVLPLTITAGHDVQASLFFPVTLKPRELALRCRAADQVRDLVLPLGSVPDLSRQPPYRVKSSQATGQPPPPATPIPGANP